VVTPEGNRIMRFDYIFKETANVKECQVVQEKLGEIILRIVIRPGYASRDEEAVRKEIRRWISPRLNISFEYIDEIQRDGSGKFKAVKSLLRAGPSASAN
jgi:phenylacetate-CoA ligase